MIKVECCKCREELEEPGGILLDAPNIKGLTIKYHICKDCLSDVFYFLGVLFNISDYKKDHEEAYLSEPPSWAIWKDMGMFGEQCGDCGRWCEAVRPGKTQCPVCN